ncbi:site-specific integrase [Desulfothermus naphthae]
MKLFKRKNGYWYIRFARGKEKSLKTKDKKLAEKLFRALYKEALEGKLILLEKYQKITLQNFIKEYLEYSASIKSHATYKRDKIALKKLLDFLGDIPLKIITPKKIEEFHTFLLRKGHKPSGVNVEIRHIKAAFNKAVFWGYLKSNPYGKIKLLKVPKRPPKFLKEQEIELILKSIDDQNFKELIICYLETGCRRQELLNLRKEDVDLQNGFIRVKGKGDKIRLIPLTKTVKKILQKRLSTVKGEQLFLYHPDTVTHKWIKLMRKLGLNYRLHDLRHTTASYLAIQGIPLKFIQELLGHSDITTTQIYAHLRPEDLQSALNISILSKSKNAGKMQACPLKILK